MCRPVDVQPNVIGRPVVIDVDFVVGIEQHVLDFLNRKIVLGDVLNVPVRVVFQVPVHADVVHPSHLPALLYFTARVAM